MGKINSRAKGCRFEREVRDIFRDAGFEARRGQQFSGGSDSPDVIIPDLHDEYHVEAKFVEALNIYKAMAQAIQDAEGKIPLVFHKKSHQGVLVTMLVDDFMELLVKNHDNEQRKNNDPLHTHGINTPIGRASVGNAGDSCQCDGTCGNAN